jgi:general secretion pathway protein L
MAIHVGLDIGTTAVKVAVVRAQYRKVRVEALASVDVVAAPTLEAAIHQAMSLALGGKPGGHDGIAVGLEGDRLAFRQLSLPSSASKQLQAALPYELESKLPFDLDDAVWDYRLLTTARRTSIKSTDLDIFAAVAKLEDVRTRIELVKAAVAVEPERVGVAALPLVNLLGYLPNVSATDAVAIVDIGTRRSEIVISVCGELAFARAVSFGTEGLPGTASRLARELRATIASFRSQGGAAPVQVVLSGGGAFVAGAEAFIAAELGVPVHSITKLNVELNPLIAADALGAMPRFAKSIGLALSLGARAEDLNLRRGPLAFERGFGWIKEKLPLVAGLGIVIGATFGASVLMQLVHAAQEHAVLSKALSAVTNDVLGEATDDAERANTLLAQRAAGADEDPLPHADAFDVMVRLSEAVPQSVVHDIDELDIQKGHVTVRGVVASVSDAQSIAGSLKSEPCFADVKITRTNQMVGGDRQKYEMEFDLKCPEDQKAKKKPDAKAAESAAATASGGGK